MITNTLTFILAGGTGTRLYPLTADRTKPAVPFGGKYRIIDFTLANCLHSGLRRVLALTQYKSHSLQKHLRDGWSIFNPELGEYITTVPAQMRKGETWYEGTADAIYQNLYLLERSDAEWVLILSGDHIYRMDYAAMLESLRSQNADATIACMEVDINEASDFGIMSINNDHRITTFNEKPKMPSCVPGDPEHALASMGIYAFSRQILIEALEKDSLDDSSTHDFGKDILPKLIQTHHVHAYQFGSGGGRVTPDKYWRDVGTIDAYYQANMDLLKSIPPVNLYQNDWTIRTYQAQTPPARTVPGKSGSEGICINSIVAGGVIIAGGNVSHSILFREVFVDDEAFVEDSILFAGVHVGANTRLQNCIVDKHVQIPANEEIGFNMEKDKQRFSVSPQGIVVVPKGFQFV